MPLLFLLTWPRQYDIFKVHFLRSMGPDSINSEHSLGKYLSRKAVFNKWNSRQGGIAYGGLIFQLFRDSG